VAMPVTWLARAGWMLEQPLFWGSVATALAGRGGTRGRQAALRGSVYYVVAAVIANIVIKPLVDRRRPQGAGEGRITPVTSSFPSGHTASDSAFVFGVAQELPGLAVPLAAAATAAHWSLIHSEKHHVSDVLAGGAIGLGVAHIMRKSWPSDMRRNRTLNHGGRAQRASDPARATTLWRNLGDDGAAAAIRTAVIANVAAQAR
jgi:membrane-associated phospholipid phosphatase